MANMTNVFSPFFPCVNNEKPGYSSKREKMKLLENLIGFGRQDMPAIKLTISTAKFPNMTKAGGYVLFVGYNWGWGLGILDIIRGAKL